MNHSSPDPRPLCPRLTLRCCPSSHLWRPLIRYDDVDNYDDDDDDDVVVIYDDDDVDDDDDDDDDDRLQWWIHATMNLWFLTRPMHYITTTTQDTIVSKNKTKQNKTKQFRKTKQEPGRKKIFPFSGVFHGRKRFALMDTTSKHRRCRTEIWKTVEKYGKKIYMYVCWIVHRSTLHYILSHWFMYTCCAYIGALWVYLVLVTSVVTSVDLSMKSNLDMKFLWIFVGSLKCYKFL